MTRCRIPEFCERYNVVIGICNLRSERFFPRSVIRRNMCLCIRKIHFCVIWKINRKDSFLKTVREKERNFKNVKNKRDEENLGQRIRYRFAKHETMDQLEYVFVFNLEIYNDQKFAEAYAVGSYDVDRLRDKWVRDLTPEEIQAKR